MSEAEARPNPLHRSVTMLLILLALTAFLPHRERALLLTMGGDETLLLSEALESNNFGLPSPFGIDIADRFGFKDFSPLPGRSLNRSRFGPPRDIAAFSPPPGLRGAPGAGGDTSAFPLGEPGINGIPGSPPVLSTGPSGGVGGGGGNVPGGGGPGFGGPFPGGGGGGGGGSISFVPEPGTWAMMIFGFGLIGARLRRRRAALLLTKRQAISV